MARSPCLRSLTKSCEERTADWIIGGAIFGVPLNGERKAGRIGHIDRLGRAIGRVAVNHDAWPRDFYALPVQRVGQHRLRSHQPMERPVFGEGHIVAQGEFLFNCAIGRHPVVHPPGQVPDLRVKRAAHGHVHLLKTAADTEERLAAIHASADQWQGHTVAGPVHRSVRLGISLAIFFGMHVGPSAGEEEAIADLHQLVHIHETRVGRDDHGQTTADLGHSLGIHRPARMGRILIIEEVKVSDDTDDRFAHASSNFADETLPNGEAPEGKGVAARRVRRICAHDAEIGTAMIYRLNDPSFLNEPAPVLAQMRAEGPLVQVKMPIVGKIWMTTDDAGARALLKNPDLFRRDPGPITGKPLAQRFWWMPGFFKPLLDTMIVADDPKHKRLRGLVDQAFARTTMEDLRPELEAMADRLLDELPGGEVDIVRHYTRPLPFLAICALLGIPDDARASLAKRVAPLSSVTNPFGAIYAILRLRGVLADFRALFAEARAHPRPGLISALVHAEEDGAQLNEQELLAMVLLLFLAGHETTVHLINNAIVTLATESGLRTHFTDNPQTRHLFVEEVVRHASPVMTTKMMFAARDTEILGAPIKKGEMVAPLLIGANHDPAHFDAPEDFVPDRRPNAHLGFGFGPHVCLGMQLARIEASVALERLVARHPDLQLAQTPAYLRRPGLRAPATLRLHL